MGIPGPTIRENEANASDPLGFSEGIEFLMSQGKMIALLPIEKWLEDLEHADVVGPFIDPTLYREYLRSGRDKMLKSVLLAGISLKAAILQSQADVKSGSVR
jgi:hypothetical protein